MGVETLPNALGSKAYVHLVALGTEDAVNEGCVHAGEGLCEGIRCSGHCGVQMRFPTARARAWAGVQVRARVWVKARAWARALVGTRARAQARA